MKTMKKLLLAAMLASFAVCTGANARDFKEGPVSEVAAIQITSGHLDDYMAYLRSEWKPEQEALKKAGLIVDYRVYSTSPRRPGDPDLYLVVTYANMAALDGFDERSEKVLEPVSGDRAKSQKGVSDRNTYRTIIGTELIRELEVQ